MVTFENAGLIETNSISQIKFISNFEDLFNVKHVIALP